MEGGHSCSKSPFLKQNPVGQCKRILALTYANLEELLSRLISLFFWLEGPFLSPITNGGVDPYKTLKPNSPRLGTFQGQNSSTLAH